MKSWRDASDGGRRGAEAKQERATPGKHTLTEQLGSETASAREAMKGGTDAKGLAADGAVAGAADAATPGAAEPATPGATEPGTAAPAARGAAAPGQASPALPAPAPAPATAAAVPAAAELAAKQERVLPRMSLAGTAVGESVASTHELDSSIQTKHQGVAATGSPTFNAAAGSNDCTPSPVSGASVTWDVVDKPATWGVNIKSFTTTGVINVAPWPSKPTELVTPNTANPVDGGNITDASGNNNWKFAVKEMEEYHQAGGGRSSYWHSYEASKAHEWAHWNTDWMVTCIGALWPTANTDLDAITIPKADAANAAAARPLLQAKIDARMATLRSALVAKWNPIPDSPGAAGSTGYDAGQAVLNGLIANVKAYAATKKWT